jgi:hypothetical protein
VNPNPKLKQEDSVSTRNSVSHLINNLWETIIVHNKMKRPLCRKHKTILVGNRHVTGYVSTLKLLLNSDYGLYCVVKPGSGTNERKESAKEVIRQLSHDDLIVTCSGTNDCDFNDFSLTSQNIKNYIKSNNHTNILLMNVPFWYDLTNSFSVNKNISVLNRKLQRLVNVFPHTIFLGSVNKENYLRTMAYTEIN